MGFISRFEDRVEDSIDRASDQLIGAPISPVQIAKRAEKQMNRNAMLGAGKQYAPTLYTVLVNPDDDDRLFGYYPTLAGETETYISAKAMDAGLDMDGAPLVRFIADDTLKRGKFDVIAELVSAPIVEQLRAEEFERYGIAPRQAASAPQRMGAAAGAGAGFAGAAAGVAAPQQPVAAAPQRPIPATPQQQTPQAFDPYAPFDDAYYGKSSAIYLDDTEDDEFEDDAFEDSAFDSDFADNNGYDDFDNADFLQNPPTMVMGAAIAAPKNPTPARLPISAAELLDTSANTIYRLTEECYLLGRDSSSSINVNDINASRRHAQIRFDAVDGWVIEDLGSTNGTLVNGRLASSMPLFTGDVITIGTTKYVFTDRA